MKSLNSLTDFEVLVVIRRGEKDCKQDRQPCASYMMPQRFARHGITNHLYVRCLTRSCRQITLIVWLFHQHTHSKRSYKVQPQCYNSVDAKNIEHTLSPWRFSVYLAQAYAGQERSVVLLKQTISISQIYCALCSMKAARVIMIYELR